MRIEKVDLCFFTLEEGGTSVPHQTALTADLILRTVFLIAKVATWWHQRMGLNFYAIYHLIFTLELIILIFWFIEFFRTFFVWVIPWKSRRHELKIAFRSSIREKKTPFLILWSRQVDLHPSSNEFLQKRKNVGFRPLWFSKCWPLEPYILSLSLVQAPSATLRPLPSVSNLHTVRDSLSPKSDQFDLDRGGRGGEVGVGTVGWGVVLYKLSV